jgi:hypothetical protein
MFDCRVDQTPQCTREARTNGKPNCEGEFDKIEAIQMATSRLTPDQIAQVSGLVAEYIATQREKYVPKAIPLSSQQKNAVRDFFHRNFWRQRADWIRDHSSSFSI